jgi:hypothetical protein
MQTTSGDDTGYAAPVPLSPDAARNVTTVETK